MEKIKAVITADIVNSTLLNKVEFDTLLERIEKLLKSEKLQFGFYRGDSIHALCEVMDALRITCLLRTLAIKSPRKEEITDLDIRVSIGIGKVEYPVKELGIAKGEAFVLSGREMEMIGKTGPRLSIRTADKVADTGLAAIAFFTDYLVSRLTLKQAEVIYELLQGSTQVKAARRLRKAQSTVNKHSRSAGWKEIAGLLELYSKMEGLITT